ncbi:class I SAM-dependent methyltransferase [Geminicoccus flavidas]|uniref:class I SAM-dependent methyltransferase n=1 Tax=Geminicoccus flavidas TaxID=2506407 RepID=UPI0013583EEB|nr:class I SAM-dependent methyltransferase [Geminicoccus flavidas]
MSEPVCKACGSTDLELFYRVDRIPVHSCLMVDSRQEALDFPRGDLELGFCNSCGFIENVRFDPKPQNYSPAYEETQAFSPRFVRFLEEICDDQIRKFHLKPGKTALEIGCGKGEFLVTLCERSGASGIGIDPGYRPERTVSEAADRLQFIQDFYGPKYRHLQADHVSCRHTLEHIHDVQAFMQLVRESIGDRPHVDVFFELPDAERVLTEPAFWDIYYEHCSYFTLGSLSRLFRRTGFDVTNLWKAYDDQYLMLEAKPVDEPTEPRLALEDDLTKTRAQVRQFKAVIGPELQRLRDQFLRWQGEGKKVALWGSGSKAVSLITTLKIAEQVAAVVDINPHKHGKFLAGCGNEILSPQALAEIRPDVVVAVNPIYLNEIGQDLAKLGLEPELTAL